MSKGGHKAAAATRRLGETPPIGVVATGENDAEIARLLLRARRHDLSVMLTYLPGTDPDVVSWVANQDVRIIPPVGLDGDLAGDHGHEYVRLISASQGRPFPGLILVEDTTQRIDFQRTLEAYKSSEGYVQPAIPEPEYEIGTMVAIPAHNEVATIEGVVERAARYADEVLVIDDGSSDLTGQRAEMAGATVVRHERNRGYGAALKTAFEVAAERDAQRLVVLDGDDQHDPADVPRLVEAIDDGEANVAIGSRFVGETASPMPLYRRFGLGVVNLMTNLSMGTVSPRSWIRNTQSGFRAYDRCAIETLAEAEGIGDDMDASIDILYVLNEGGFTVEERPTEVNYDVENGSSQNPISHGLRLVSTILRTVEREHPVLLLGVPGFMITLFGMILGYMTVANYVATATFPTGLAIGSVFAVLLGVFSCFTAIVLHSLQAHLGDLNGY